MSDLYWLSDTQMEAGTLFLIAPRLASCGRQSGVERHYIHLPQWLNSKLHVVTDAAGRPLRMFLTDGQRSDYIGARALLDGLPPAKHMLADRGYDSDWYLEALEDKGITPCIPSRKNRKVPIPHDEARYRKHHKIENSLARLKDWRRVATRYDRCPKVFLSACALAAIVMFWL